VRRGWDALQATLADADRSLPAFVNHEVERALSCGDPTGGFASLACADGHHHRLVPYSCQTRGFCPSCGGRRMVERALRRTEELIPRVAVRQLVLTVPWPRRLLLEPRPELARGLMRCALAEVTRWLRREGVRRGESGEPGMLPVMQRFGAARTRSGGPQPALPRPAARRTVRRRRRGRPPVSTRPPVAAGRR
jgi:hypothetical protein